MVVLKDLSKLKDIGEDAFDEAQALTIDLVDQLSYEDIACTFPALERCFMLKDNTLRMPPDVRIVYVDNLTNLDKVACIELMR